MVLKVRVASHTNRLFLSLHLFLLVSLAFSIFLFENSLHRYHKHIAQSFSRSGPGDEAAVMDEENDAPSIVLLTNDAASLKIAKEMGLTAYRGISALFHTFLHSYCIFLSFVFNSAFAASPFCYSVSVRLCSPVGPHA